MTASELRVGQLRTRKLLGTVATYCICDYDDQLVEVEVVDAPGLNSGRRFRLTRRAVEAMAVAGQLQNTDVPEGSRDNARQVGS